MSRRTLRRETGSTLAGRSIRLGRDRRGSCARRAPNLRAVAARSGGSCNRKGSRRGDTGADLAPRGARELLAAHPVASERS